MNTLEMFGNDAGAPLPLGPGIFLLRGFADSSRLMPLIERVAHAAPPGAALTRVRMTISNSAISAPT